MTHAAIIAGVGPGFCESFAWKLAREGHPVGLFGRSEAYLESVASALQAEGFEAIAVPTDVTDPAAVEAGVKTVRGKFGPVSVLAYTASTVTDAPEDGVDPARMKALWELYTYGSVLCVNTLLSDLRETHGTILFFGAAPGTGDIAYQSAKAGARGFARALANETAAKGVHVTHVVIDGGLLNPDVYDQKEPLDEGAYIDIDATAETCYHLIEQPARAQTFELDLHGRSISIP